MCAGDDISQRREELERKGWEKGVGWRGDAGEDGARTGATCYGRWMVVWAKGKGREEGFGGMRGYMGDGSNCNGGLL